MGIRFARYGDDGGEGGGGGTPYFFVRDGGNGGGGGGEGGEVCRAACFAGDGRGGGDISDRKTVTGDSSIRFVMKLILSDWCMTITTVAHS